MAGSSTMIHALALLALIPVAAGQPWPFCGTTQGDYLANSACETNLQDLLRALRKTASSSPSLFASGDLGAAPDTAWGLVLCRGDVSADDCRDCVSASLGEAATACSSRNRDVALCYDKCYVRLSFTQDFLDPAGNSGEVNVSDGTVMAATTDVGGYGQAVTGLLRATAQHAVANSSRMFATGQWVGPGFPNIYSAAQCAADLSPADCQRCLNGLVGKWWTTFPSNVSGARMAGARCTLRSQLTPFYSGSAMVLLPLPTTAAAPTPTPTNTRGTWLVLMLHINYH